MKPTLSETSTITSELSPTLAGTSGMRDSNMELLRIVAMSMILTGHFFLHGFGGTFPITYPGSISMPITICGVNLFFLLSGWYCVRFTLKSITRIVVTTIFFIWINVAVLAMLGIGHGLRTDKLILTPLEASNYWFINAYIGLLIITPVINAGLRNLTSRQVSVLVAATTIFSIYCGWYGDNFVNFNGYSIFQAIWLYFLGYWLRNNQHITRKISSIFLIVLYLAAAVTLVKSLEVERFSEVKWDAYNNPLVVVMSLALFICFTRIRLRSRVINCIAAASLGCYLLQDGLFGGKFMYERIGRMYRHFVNECDFGEGVVWLILVLTAIFVGIWVASLLLTPVANRLSALTAMGIRSCYEWMISSEKLSKKDF